jgi:hypothetical protein
MKPEVFAGGYVIFCLSSCESDTEIGICFLCTREDTKPFAPGWGRQCLRRRVDELCHWWRAVVPEVIDSFGVPYGNRTRVAAVKEKRFTGLQRKPAAWIAL